MGIYCEFFYHAHGADVGFDPEFPASDPGEVCRLRLKNLNNLLHFETADAGISPTHWQASTFPEPFRSKITVVHDGIDTGAGDLRAMQFPDSAVSLPCSSFLNRDRPVVKRFRGNINFPRPRYGSAINKSSTKDIRAGRSKPIPLKNVMKRYELED